MLRIFEPSFRCREASLIHTTRHHNINEAALNTCYAASIDPKDTPEPIMLVKYVSVVTIAEAHLSRFTSANLRQTSLFPEPPMPIMTNLFCPTSFAFGIGSQSFSRSVSKICFRPVKKLLTGLGTNQWTLSKYYSSVLSRNVFVGDQARRYCN